MLLAGTDGLRLTLHWVVLFAAMYPEVQKKMQKEIDDVIGMENVYDMKFKYPRVKHILPRLLFSLHTLIDYNVTTAIALEFSVKSYKRPTKM